MTRKGANNPRWKGGISEDYLHSVISVDGKICERCGSEDDLVRHHKDEDRTNNTGENLEILCRGCHTREHAARGAFKKTEGQKSKLSKAAMGNQKWKGRKHTEESKRKMSEAQKRRQHNRSANGRFS